MFRILFFSVFRKMKRLYLCFLILLIFVVIAFFYIFVFRYLRKKVNNLEIVDLFTRQKKLIMLPDVTHSRTYNDAVV